MCPQNQLLEVKSQALLLGRVADSIKTGSKVSNPPRRVKLTNTILCPVYKDPAIAGFWETELVFWDVCNYH